MGDIYINQTHCKGMEKMGILEKYRQDKDDQIVEELKAGNKRMQQALTKASSDYTKIFRENKRLKIYLDMYEQDASTLLEKWVLNPDDKIDREILKRMLNYLIGENRRLKNEATRKPN